RGRAPHDRLGDERARVGADLEPVAAVPGREEHVGESAEWAEQRLAVLGDGAEPDPRFMQAGVAKRRRETPPTAARCSQPRPSSRVAPATMRLSGKPSRYCCAKPSTSGQRAVACPGL